MSNTSLEYTKNPAGWEIATLTITRPEQLNALNLETIAEIDSHIDALSANKNVRTLIVTGSGNKAFVAGADVKQLETLDKKGAHDLSTEGNRVFMKLSALPFPVIAAVNGFALGGGCELALSCDIRIASETASFSLPEVTLGICPGWGGTQRLARIVGYGIASELMFSARRIKAERAVQIGLVSSVHPSEELMGAAIELATQIGANAPLAVAAAKKSMREGVETTLEQGVEIEAREFSVLFNSTDTKEGLASFNNKEKYEYKGE